jgi:hypothetical protein
MGIKTTQNFTLISKPLSKPILPLSGQISRISTVSDFKKTSRNFIFIILPPKKKAKGF